MKQIWKDFFFRMKNWFFLQFESPRVNPREYYFTSINNNFARKKNGSAWVNSLHIEFTDCVDAVSCDYSWNVTHLKTLPLETSQLKPLIGVGKIRWKIALIRNIVDEHKFHTHSVVRRMHCIPTFRIHEKSFDMCLSFRPLIAIAFAGFWRNEL